MHAVVTNGVISKIKFLELWKQITLVNNLTLLVYSAFESAIIALMPKRKDYKLRALEFFTFLLSKSSLNNFAFSTIQRYYF